MNKFPAQDFEPRSRKPGYRAVIAAAAAILLIAGIGIFMRVRESAALDDETQKAAIPAVTVIKAPRGPVTEDIVLPGNVQAWHEAPIFARTNGYLKSWTADIGRSVKEGDILAEIDTPEVDAQLRQVEADLATAQANDKLAQSTARRWNDLLKANAVSKQDADDKIGAAAASAAALNAAQANLDRLRQLESFKRIVAPFDGVITARNTDTGALINAGAGQELFHIVETDKLRVYVSMPQLYVSFVTPDLTAELRFAEHPGKIYAAKLARTAEALDPATRTLLVQLEVDNKDGELLPGGYTEVHFKLPSSSETVRLPVNTLLFRGEGMQVATVDQDNKALLKSIDIGRDYGKEVEVKSGISPDERIIVNPPDSLVTGQPVRIVQPQQPKPPEQNGGKP
ncbi:MAG: efflux RND transporter periplasmic adaptor subunit [Alphaproteobacteria bacterium]